MKEKKKEIVVWQKNELNEMRNTTMTPIEAKIFEFYLAAIDYRHPKSAYVKLYLEEYKEITGLKQIQFKDMVAPVKTLFEKSIFIPEDVNKPHNGVKKGFEYGKLRHLFDTCDIKKDGLGRPYIELQAHKDVLPLLFEWKPKNFTRYRLAITLSLSSFKQIQLYKIFKQHLNDQAYCLYEAEIPELKEKLGIKQTEYVKLVRFKEFLNSCQSSFEKKTDISFTYEKGRSGERKAWTSIIFHLFKNEKNFIDAYISENTEEQEDVNTSEQNKENITKRYGYSDKDLERLRMACENAFSETEMNIILAKLERIKYPTDSEPPYINEKEAILKEQYLILLNKEVIKAAKGEKIENRGAYFISMLENLCTIPLYRIF